MMRNLKCELRPALHIRPGDLLGYSGEGLLSAIINLGTFALPRRGLSHIAIASWKTHRIPLVFESTMVLPETFANRCSILHRNVAGVQAHTVEQALKRPGPIWLYRRRDPESLRPSQVVKLDDELRKLVGVGYDGLGAFRSRGSVLRSYYRQFFRSRKDHLIFCSELCAMMVNLWHKELFVNPGAWNPNSLVKYLVRKGFYEAPVRVQ